MSGIGSYIDGEKGIVTSIQWAVTPELLIYRLHLEGNKNRAYAQDYGSDIGIDPYLRPGDQVEYIRLDRYAGIWVKQNARDTPEVPKALHRVKKNRKLIFEYFALLNYKGPLAKLRKKIVVKWTMYTLQQKTGIPAIEID